GFLPLIHYVDIREMYTGMPNPEINNRPIKEKPRDIMFAGHLDSYIYTYYSLKLNDLYNNWTENNDIDTCSIAYRTNKKGLSSINFAAEVVNRIVNYEEAFILVGDFTNFFDQIDHKLLKINLCRVLAETRLQDYWYNIYRSLTKYGYYKIEDINEYCGTEQSLRNQRQYSYFKSLKEFRDFQKTIKTKYNKNLYGIPQGTALSGIFANIYAIDFDLDLLKIAKRYGGLYRRYSDDFILVIPKGPSPINLRKIEQSVYNSAHANKIDLHKSKTHTYKLLNQEIKSLYKGEKSHIDYLGFIYDGKTVRIRGKSPYKFYRNSIKLIKKAKRVKGKKGLSKLPYRKKIYMLYTDLGARRRPHGNFISYVKRSQKVFDRISPSTENKMLEQIKNRKKKLEKEMGIKLHTKI